MAIRALNIYAAEQNGNTQMTVLPGPSYPANSPVPDFLAVPSPDTTSLAPTGSTTTTFVPAPSPIPQESSVLDQPTSLPTATPSQPSSPAVAGNGQRAVKSLHSLVERFRRESKHLAPSTREKFDSHFKVAAEHLNFDRDVRTITLADLRQLKSTLSNGRKPSSLNDILFKAVAALFRMAIDDEIIQRSPLERLKRAKKGEPDRAHPNWEQAQQIEAEVGRYTTETEVIIGFMRNFGVGQAEIHYLNGENVDSENGVVHFRRKKTGKPFDVPIFPHAKPFIEKLKAEGRLRLGKPVVAWRNPRKALATACERLGFPSYEPRALRRSFIVHCLQKGIDPRLIAKWQGHKDAKLIFSVYGKFIDREYEKGQAEKLGGALSQESPCDSSNRPGNSREYL
jgi:integrase